MIRQAQLILFLFYYRLHVSTYIQVIFRPFDGRVRKCYACWNPIIFIEIKYVNIENVYVGQNSRSFGVPYWCC